MLAHFVSLSCVFVKSNQCDFLNKQLVEKGLHLQLALYPRYILYQARFEAVAVTFIEIMLN